MKKKILSGFLALITMLNTTTILADETSQIDGVGSVECTVTSSVPDPNQYLVTVPKNLQLNTETFEANYSVKSEGTIVEPYAVSCVPDDNFVMINESKSVNTAVEQDRFIWLPEELDGTCMASGTVKTESELSSGLWEGQFRFVISLIDNYINTNAITQEGEAANVFSSRVIGSRETNLMSALVLSGTMEEENLPDYLVTMETDDYDSLGEVTFYLSEVAEPQDDVSIITYDTVTKEWSYITTEEVIDDKTITINFAGKEQIPFVKVNDDGSFENIPLELGPGYYDENGELLATWEQVEQDGFNVEDTDGGDNALYEITSSYNLEATAKIVMPEGITKIGYQAFKDCYKLSSIIIPTSLTYIGEEAFYNCSKLRELTIPANVTNIDEDAFYNCDSLNLTIENPDVTIGRYSLKHVANVNINKDVEEFKGAKCVNGTVMNDIFIVKDNVLHAFLGSESSTITVPDNITEIHNDAFRGWGIKDIIIPSSVTSIDSCAFYGCSHLTNIVLPEGVEVLGGYAFYRCTRLQTIVIPSSITSLGKYLFDDSDNLTTIYYTGTEDQFEDDINKHDEWGDGCNATIVYNYVRE